MPGTYSVTLTTADGWSQTNNLNSGSVSPAPRVVQAAVEHYQTITNMSPSLWVDEPT